VDVRKDYLERIVGDVKLSRPMKIVVDCGNGVAGAIAPGTVPPHGLRAGRAVLQGGRHLPQPPSRPSKPDNLKDVIRALRETDAELGLAFDGDGDRLGVVTKDGEIIYPDRQLMLFAADVLTRNPGAQIIYDVKCSRNLARVDPPPGRPCR
jgi:phosphomannomutase/phosphoglucomutase